MAESGYEPGNPKDPDYADAVVDFEDEQRKRRKEAGPLVKGARVMTTRGAGTIVGEWRDPGYRPAGRRRQVWLIVELDAGGNNHRLPFAPADVRRLG